MSSLFSRRSPGRNAACDERRVSTLEGQRSRPLHVHSSVLNPVKHFDCLIFRHIRRDEKRSDVLGAVVTLIEPTERECRMERREIRQNRRSRMTAGKIKHAHSAPSPRLLYCTHACAEGDFLCSPFTLLHPPACGSHRRGFPDQKSPSRSRSQHCPRPHLRKSHVDAVVR